MDFFESHLSILDAVLVILPLIFSFAYHGSRIGSKYLMGAVENPFHDPIPMRLWTCFALFNAFLAAADITQLLELFGCILIVTLVYMVNKKFGTNL